MRAMLLDTNVVLYAIGGPHPYAEPCRRVLALAGDGGLTLEASWTSSKRSPTTRRLRDRRQSAVDALAAAALCRLHPVEPDDARAASELFASSQTLSTRDAVFAAIAARHGLSEILSADTDFDGLPWLRRIDPADRDAIVILGEAC